MISDRQNTEINIQRLAAQRNLYTRAKRLHFIRLMLTLPTILVLSIIVALMKSQQIAGSIGIQTYDATWLLVLVSLLVFVLDRFIFEPMQQEQKAAAAAIQEEFDCNVLRIPWNDVELLKRPTREKIISNAKQCIIRYGPDKLHNWYAFPDDNLIPLAAARAICQRSNVSWDTRLRQRYILAVLVCGVAVSAIIIAVAAIYGLSSRRLLSTIVAPLLPVAGFVAGEIRQNRFAIRTLKEIRDRIEEQWQAVLACKLGDSDLLYKARQLQDRIYAHRKGSPLIPDWLYEKLRPSEEALMTATADQMKEEYVAQKSAESDHNSAGAS